MLPCLPVKDVIGSYDLLWSLQSFVWSDIVSQAEVAVLDGDITCFEACWLIIFKIIAANFMLFQILTNVQNLWILF